MPNSIIGIPTTRVNEAFIRQRMLTQNESSQLALAKIQYQLATGRRFEAPSDDPNAAMRVMNLQSLIQQKTQVKSNVSTNQSYLNITDSTLTNISSLLAEVNATALGVVGTTATDTQRQTAANQVQQTLNQLLDISNQQFRGRYLFSGTDTTLRPFEAMASGNVLYQGNEGRLQSYGDVNLLFDTNVQGNEVFGAISAEVRGTQDLNPVLTFNTRLDDLRGGLGISRGSIRLSDGTNTSIVDLSKAQTIGDVAAAIKSHPPTGRSIDVQVTADKLTLTLDGADSRVLSIQEVGGGTTANELGILREIGQSKTVESRDLNPILRQTTPLGDILGSRASAVVRGGGPQDDFIVEADVNGAADSKGAALNGVQINLVADPLVVEGSETVVYTPGASIDVHVSEGRTRSHDVVKAINAAYAAGQLPFTARLDPLESSLGGNGLVYSTASGETSGGSGENFDKLSGLQIVNNHQTYTISLATAQTIEDVLNIINGSGAGVQAQINEDRTGIDIRSRVSGSDFGIGENGGTTASQLGLRSFTRDTLLADLNYGRGVDEYAGSGARAAASFDFGIANSGLTFKSKQPGTQWDGFTISVTNTLGAPQVKYDATAKTLEFQVNAGTTTANDVLRMLAASPAAADWEGSLLATPGAANDGTGKVAVQAKSSSGADDSGVDFTIQRADGAKLLIDIAGKTTIGQVVDLINNDPNNQDHKLTARLAAYGNGIELVDTSQGVSQTAVLRSEMSQAAFDLGLIATQNGAQSDAAVGGGPSTTTIGSTAMKSGLIFSAASGGSDLNGVRVVFSLTAPAGAVFDNVGRTLTFGITPATTAADVKAMLEASSASSLFKAEFDPADTSHNDGTGFVDVTSTPPPETSGGTATTKASARLQWPGFDHDLIVSATKVGATWNSLPITLVATPGVAAAVTSYKPGEELVIGFDPGVSTANDIIAALAAHPTASADFTAALDPDNASPNLGEGIVDPTTGAEPVMSGGRQTITGRSTGMIETEGIFTALLRIKEGLANNDLFTVERSLKMLDLKVTDMNYTRAELGSREQGLDALTTRLDTEEVELKGVLSKDFDVDMVKAISDYSAQQAAFQASLQAMGKIMQMSLLNYL